MYLERRFAQALLHRSRPAHSLSSSGRTIRGDYSTGQGHRFLSGTPTPTCQGPASPRRRCRRRRRGYTRRRHGPFDRDPPRPALAARRRCERSCQRAGHRSARRRRRRSRTIVGVLLLLFDDLAAIIVGADRFRPQPESGGGESSSDENNSSSSRLGYVSAPPCGRWLLEQVCTGRHEALSTFASSPPTPPHLFMLFIHWVELGRSDSSLENTPLLNPNNQQCQVRGGSVDTSRSSAAGRLRRNPSADRVGRGGEDQDEAAAAPVAHARDGGKGVVLGGGEEWRGRGPGGRWEGLEIDEQGSVASPGRAGCGEAEAHGEDLQWKRRQAWTSRHLGLMLKLMMLVVVGSSRYHRKAKSLRRLCPL